MWGSLDPGLKFCSTAQASFRTLWDQDNWSWIRVIKGSELRISNNSLHSYEGCSCITRSREPGEPYHPALWHQWRFWSTACIRTRGEKKLVMLAFYIEVIALITKTAVAVSQDPSLCVTGNINRFAPRLHWVTAKWTNIKDPKDWLHHNDRAASDSRKILRFITDSYSCDEQGKVLKRKRETNTEQKEKRILHNSARRSGIASHCSGTNCHKLELQVDQSG